MIRDERLSKIMEYIEKNKYVNIHQLVQHFSVSKSTIRRDLEILEALNEIQLTHGGAKYKKEINLELPYDEKRKANIDEKSRIGKAACEHIKEGHRIIIDTGTTTREMIPYLLGFQNIHVITNDVMIAADLAQNTKINITLTGGTIRQGYYTLSGYYAENFLKLLHSDIAFLSLDSLDPDFGGAIHNIEEVAIKQRIIKASANVICLLDHTKFEKRAMLKVCDIFEINSVITGHELPEEILNRFTQNDCALQVV